MSSRKLIVAAALMSVAATARAGFASTLSEPATVTLVFVAMSAIAFACTRRAKPASIEA